MPRQSLICGVIDCGRNRHAKGLCRRHYGEQVRKAAKQNRSATSPSQAPQSAKAGGVVKFVSHGGSVVHLLNEQTGLAMCRRWPGWKQVVLNLPEGPQRFCDKCF